MSAWSLVGLLVAVRIGAAAARSTTMARRVDAVDEVPNFMKKARPALTRQRLDVPTTFAPTRQHLFGAAQLIMAAARLKAGLRSSSCAWRG